MKTYRLPAQISEILRADLKALGLKWEQIPSLAKVIVELSTAYQRGASVSDWSTPERMAAYLVYFRTLNQVRWLKLLDEAQRLDIFQKVDRVVDFGAGPATLPPLIQPHLQSSNEISWLAIDQEQSLAASFRHASFAKTQFQSGDLPRSRSDADLLICSYSLNELKSTPKTLFTYAKILIMEPSTKEAFAKLRALRQSLIEEGYQILAPCTHQDNCPLQGPKDWCHDRVYWEQPEWFQQLESKLPIKNPNLSFSYLIASKDKRTQQSEEKQVFRLVGDALPEKGKTRWLACTDSHKRFLSFLHRQGEPPRLYRGDLLSLSPREGQGPEWRLTPEDVMMIQEAQARSES